LSSSPPTIAFTTIFVQFDAMRVIVPKKTQLVASIGRFNLSELTADAVVI
jgi:hypothetical protein